MDSKKNAGRFTVNFNAKNKEHVEAARILNSKGRSKADYIARAVQAYEEQEKQEDLFERIEIAIVENIRKALYGDSDGDIGTNIVDDLLRMKYSSSKPEKPTRQRPAAKPKPKIEPAWEEPKRQIEATPSPVVPPEIMTEKPAEKKEPEPFAKEDHLPGDKKPVALEYGEELLKSLDMFKQK